MKCDICGKGIEETFLEKIIGTVVKDKKGKKHFVCSKCQTQFRTKEEVLGKL